MRRLALASRSTISGDDAHDTTPVAFS